LVQVPSEPGTAQLLHAVQEELPQQTPSTQKPEVHSPPSPQALPLALVPQRPLPSHWLGGWHWPLSVQELKQSVPCWLQTKGAQAWVAPGWHTPAPSQLETSVRWPALQEALRQTVPGAYRRQAPRPSHTPSVWQLAGPSSRHCPAGSEPPAATGAQVPAWPAWLQAKQLAVQALAQQTPWAQKLDWHSVAPAHSAPSAFLPQELFWQTAGAAHWASPAQDEPQVDPLQRNGAQEVEAGVRQLPPLQVPTWVSRLLAESQLPARQMVPPG
jgi:hypothetical protein